jgi:hypothetical protein
MSQDLIQFLAQLKSRYPAETEFHQAVTEVTKSVWPFIEKNPKFRKAKILERVVEPERVIIFRVNWIDRDGEVQVNRGYRVQMNSAIGPYKGGCASTRPSRSARSSSSPSSRCSRTRSLRCRWAAARAGRTSTGRARPTRR